MRIEKALSTLTAVSIIGALVFSPLAFGAVEPWAYSVLAVLAYTALTAAIAKAIVTGSIRRLAVPMLLPAVLALLLVAAQYVEWPVGFLGAVSPRAVKVYQDAATSPGSEETIVSLSPSLYRHATRDALICLSSYVALFLATCAYVRSRKHVSRLAAAIVAVGFVTSLLGMMQNLSGTGKLYWWRELTHGGAPFGPFVSRNQFAAYAGICLFVGLGLLLARGAHAAGSVRQWREGLRRILAARVHQNFLVAFAVGVMGFAVVWSLSRAGILSLMLSFAGVLVALRVAGFARTKLLYVAAVVMIILGWVTYLGWEPVISRLSSLEAVARDPLGDRRWQMFADAGRMGLDFPVLGTGAGTFLSVYPFYRTLPTHAVTRSPHNEYLHVFAEAGFSGLAILFSAMVLLYRPVIRGLLVGNSAYVRGFLAGGLGALLLPTLHSVVDFPMRSPAIAATIAVTAALLCRAAVIEFNSNRSPRTTLVGGACGRTGELTASEPVEPTSSGGGHFDKGGMLRGIVALVVAGIPWTYACNFALNPLRGQLEARLISTAEQQVVPDTENVLDFVRGAENGIRSHSPGDALAYARLADFAWNASARITDPVKRLNLVDLSLKLRMTAARLEPLNADHPFEAAMAYLSLRRSDLALLQADRARDVLPNDPWIRAHLADGFLAFRLPELARGYLEDAERLAAARGITEAKPLIAKVRDRAESLSPL